MDTLRGTFDSGDVSGEDQDWDAQEEDTARDLPPEAIGQDERRMQVRAYNHWASLLGDRTFPSIEELEPHNLPDFGPHSVLLDFSTGIEDPAVQFLGAKLADECGAEGTIVHLSDVPPRSLLSRITDHYMQILANEAPIGFEAEFVNQRGASIMYRGILLPFSSNDETIDFIYGVINWKEIADQVTADELLLEIDQAIDGEEPVEDEDEPHKHHADPVTDWADSPVSERDEIEALELDVEAEPADEPIEAFEEEEEYITSLSDYASLAGADDNGLPLPDFGQYALDDPDEEDEDDEGGAGYSFASLSDYIEGPTKKAIVLDPVYDLAPEDEVESDGALAPQDGDAAPLEAPAGTDPAPAEVDCSAFEDIQPVEEVGEAFAEEAEPQTEGEDDADLVMDLGDFIADEPVDLGVFAVEEAGPADTDDAVPGEYVAFASADADEDGLYDCLASARELAQSAKTSEDRSRQALYAAVSRAYDFSIAAQEAPEDYNELIEDSGLTVQDRAPMTPVVKLVFGVDYDKTRLTEYAAVLAHAHRMELERGSLARFLTEAEGGLKGVVQAERRLRAEESGKTVEKADEVRRALAKKLRELEALTFDAVAGEGPEFGLVMVRRDGKGNVAVLGEVEQDIALIERAARKLLG